ncbi:MAG: hypothetical protein NC920_02555 [Candidatus Omnitrophica bacterium]|nr:hypothetical protein [Candidatus Omnitrophota bacterium]
MSKPIGKGKIFLLVGNGNSLSPMEEKEFEKETILHELLASYPDLLPGDQIDPEDPRRWLVVDREVGIYEEEAGSEEFSLDLLLLDQDGIPTFVECKRASDTRSRREVVAQMLDYAANGSKYWTINKLRQRAAEFAEKIGQPLDQRIRELINTDDENKIEEFWQRVESNLKDGTIRLLFVADEIPTTLRRLTEFLNEQMENTQVLAVEIKQFVGEKHKVIVPRVLGLTESIRERKKKKIIGPRTTPKEFFSKCEAEAIEFFKFVLDEAEKREQSVNWGNVGFSVGVSLGPDKPRAPLVMCYPKDRLEIWISYLERLNATTQEIEEIKKNLINLGIFGERQRALTLKITKDNFDKAVEAYNYFLSSIDKLLNK